MIVSASRRTDIPRFHMEWLMRRFEEGYALVRNPMNRSQVSRVALDGSAVDCVAFWTKDPAPLLARRDRLEAVLPAPYFVQFTLNAYGSDVEAGLPRKAVLLETFRELSRAIGAERVVWRYSPILVGGPYTLEHHLRWFEEFARRLSGFTDTCRLSFLDVYPKIAARMGRMGIAGVPDGEKGRLARQLAEIGARCGIEVGGCGDGALDDVGLARAGCIDGAIVERVAGVAARGCAERGRGVCACVPSVDIGAYDTCANGCAYCYANPGSAPFDEPPWKMRACDPGSAMLCDALQPGDVVVARDMPPLPKATLKLF